MNGTYYIQIKNTKHRKPKKFLVIYLQKYMEEEHLKLVNFIHDLNLEDKIIRDGIKWRESKEPLGKVERRE